MPDANNYDGKVTCDISSNKSCSVILDGLQSGKIYFGFHTDGNFNLTSGPKG